jgi:hypothetical protein
MEQVNGLLHIGSDGTPALCLGLRVCVRGPARPAGGGGSLRAQWRHVHLR